MFFAFSKSKPLVFLLAIIWQQLKNVKQQNFSTSNGTLSLVTPRLAFVNSDPSISKECKASVVKGKLLP